MIRGKNAAESAVILQFSTREASKAVLKVLNSAVANAITKGASGADNLLVAEAFVDEGPILKRWRPRAQGRASRINKRTSHITLVLNEIEATEAKKSKPEAKEAKAKKGEVASSPKKKAAPRPPVGEAGNDGITTKKETVKKTPKVKKAPRSASRAKARDLSETETLKPTTSEKEKDEIATSPEEQASRNDTSKEDTSGSES
jgi:large subunit ribosomal protein L22